MKTNASHRRTPVRINTSRWAAYATAGAASALGCATGAEANITYSGIIDRHFSAGTYEVSVGHFQLDQPGDSLSVVHIGPGEGINGLAQFFVSPTRVSGAVAGFRVAPSYYSGTAEYLSKLNFGQNISARPFVSPGGTLALNYQVGRWLGPGIGFVGFQFNGGGGLQYGWARINMDGAGENSFTLIDYAFGDVGDRITAGQTSISNVPETGGSLALLAIGAAGLVAWRARRSQAAD